MDVIEFTETDTALLLKMASSLPCLAFPPELDSIRTQSGVNPNDLRLQGKSKYPYQWSILGPREGEQFGANVVKAWETFSGRY